MGTQDTILVISPWNIRIPCHSLVLCVWSDTFRNMLKGKDFESIEEEDVEEEEVSLKKTKTNKQPETTTNSMDTSSGILDIKHTLTLQLMAK